MNTRHLLSLVLLVGLTSWATCQETRPSAEALKQAADIETEIAEYTAKWRAEQRELRRKQAEEARKAKAEGRKVERPRVMSMRMRPEYDPFVDRLTALADEAKGEDAALFLSRAVKWGGIRRGSKGMAAFDRMVTNHAASPQWKDLGRMLSGLQRSLGEERCAEVMAALAKNPDGDVRGWVALSAHSGTVEKAAIESADYKAARSALQGAASNVTDKRLREQLLGAIELRERLGVGAEAPDISGIDIDGKAFKLSDYRGKVIFLDFWGDW